MSGVCSSPALATCEKSRVLLTGMPGGFSRASVFAPPLCHILTKSMKYKELELSSGGFKMLGEGSEAERGGKWGFGGREVGA